MTPNRRVGGSRGFTLIELMVAVAVVAILAAVAMPSYTAYIQRSRVAPMLDALSAYRVRMEQRFQDSTDGYASTTGCAVNISNSANSNYSLTCELTPNGGFRATATGSGNISGYTYTIDQDGNRVTTAHPRTASNLLPMSCWTIKGTVCDDA